MNRIQMLQNTMTLSQILVTDPVSIDYLIGGHYEVGERMLALLVYKHKAPLLFVNAMFETHPVVETIQFSDGMDPVFVLSQYLATEPVGIDGTWPSRFTLRLLELGYTLSDSSRFVEALRAVKSNEECRILEIASAHNDRIMADVETLLTPGISELEIADKIREWQHTSPLEGISFDPIVLFTENIADPHGVPSKRKLKKDDVVLIDMGGIYEGYCSDMTRCFFMGHNEKLESLYKIVHEANKAAIKAVRPGVPLKEVDRAARSVIEEYGYGDFFIHRCGHGVGREVHETLDVSAANDTLIKAGMCFSIEPGIYIPEVGGIRIEDLVIATEKGSQVLNHFKKEFDEICVTL